MKTYPKDWNKRKTAIRNKLGNRCKKCGIVLSRETFHHWKGKLRPDSMFLHTHHRERLSEGGNHSLKNLTLLCAGCHSYEDGHDHMQETTEVSEFYNIFRSFYFNKKREKLYEEIEKVKSKKDERVRPEEIQATLARLKPRGVDDRQFKKDFNRLVTISAKQEKIALNNFRFNNFQQALIMLHNFYSRNTFGILPTGGGKSLCFTAVAEAIQNEGITVVISPLLSLMQDMKVRFKKCEQFNSTLGREERRAVIRKIKDQKISLLLISPERLKVDDFKKLLEEVRIARLVIDEAHCISQWGGFRIKYRRIIDFVLTYNEKHQKQLPVLLLTATASESVFDDILQNMKLDRNKVAIVIPKSLERKNLHYSIVRCSDDKGKFKKLRSLLRRNRGKKGIVFCPFANKGANVKDSFDVKAIVEELSNIKEVDVRPYHGKMSSEERTGVQNWFTAKVTHKAKVLVATNAFGMGIDIPDIRFIVHFYSPLSMEAYWQETGRAGRDGNDSFCTLMYSGGDEKRTDAMGLLPRFERFVLNLESLVNGRILIPSEFRTHVRFSRFVKELVSAKVFKKTVGKKTIHSKSYIVYSIREELPKTIVRKMWKIVSPYPKTFHGFSYRRITALIEIYNSRSFLDGKTCLQIPTQTKNRDRRLLALAAVSTYMNPFIELGIFSMDITFNGFDRFFLEDEKIGKDDYAELKEWLDGERKDFDEAKETIRQLVRKRNLQKFASNYFKEELKKLSVVYPKE